MSLIGPYSSFSFSTHVYTYLYVHIAVLCCCLLVVAVLHASLFPGFGYSYFALTIMTKKKKIESLQFAQRRATLVVFLSSARLLRHLQYKERHTALLSLSGKPRHEAVSHAARCCFFAFRTCRLVGLVVFPFNAGDLTTAWPSSSRRFFFSPFFSSPAPPPPLQKGKKGGVALKARLFFFNRFVCVCVCVCALRNDSPGGCAAFNERRLRQRTGREDVEAAHI